MIKRGVAELVRFPLNRVTRVAFDFWVEFSRWRTRKTGGDGKSNASLINDYAMLEVIRELQPRPEWAARALANPYKEIKSRSGSYLIPRRILLPENFLLENC